MLKNDQFWRVPYLYGGDGASATDIAGVGQQGSNQIDSGIETCPDGIKRFGPRWSRETAP